MAAGSASVGAFTLKGPPGLELDLGLAAHFVARIRCGRVLQAEYTGPSGTFLGRHAAYEPLVKACEEFL